MPPSKKGRSLTLDGFEYLNRCCTQFYDSAFCWQIFDKPPTKQMLTLPLECNDFSPFYGMCGILAKPPFGRLGRCIISGIEQLTSPNV